jgi:hypothetical protein
MFVVACASEALAYVDPGTGSYVLQIVIAGLVAGLFAVKTFWLQIVAFFGGLFGRRPPTRRDDG